MALEGGRDVRARQARRDRPRQGPAHPPRRARRPQHARALQRHRDAVRPPFLSFSPLFTPLSEPLPVLRIPESLHPCSRCRCSLTGGRAAGQVEEVQRHRARARVRGDHRGHAQDDAGLPARREIRHARRRDRRAPARLVEHDHAQGQPHLVPWCVRPSPVVAGASAVVLICHPYVDGLTLVGPWMRL